MSEKIEIDLGEFGSWSSVVNGLDGEPKEKAIELIRQSFIESEKLKSEGDRLVVESDRCYVRSNIIRSNIGNAIKFHKIKYPVVIDLNSEKSLLIESAKNYKIINKL